MFARLLDVVDIFVLSATAATSAAFAHFLVLLDRLLSLGQFFPLVHFAVLVGVLLLDVPELALRRNALFDVPHRYDNDHVRDHKGELGFLLCSKFSSCVVVEREEVAESVCVRVCVCVFMCMCAIEREERKEIQCVT